MKLKIGILASHGGSNMQAIINACKENQIYGVVSVVICNNSNAGAVDKAEKAGIPVYHLSNRNYQVDSDLDEAISIVLKKYNVNIVALAGYMKKLGPIVLKEYKSRILNIHPALLPKHGGSGMYGINVHKSVIASGDKESGATVHLVNENYDEGGVLSQVIVRVSENETPETLAEKVLVEEHRLYTITLEKISKGEIKLG